MQGVPERRLEKLSLDVGVATDVGETVSSRISLPEVPVNIVNRGIGRRSLHVTAGVNRNREPDYFYFGVGIHIKTTPCIRTHPSRSLFTNVIFWKRHLSLSAAVLYLALAVVRHLLSADGLIDMDVKYCMYLLLEKCRSRIQWSSTYAVKHNVCLCKYILVLLPARH